MDGDFGWGAAIGGVIVAIIAGLFGWLRQRGQSKAEIEVAVLGEWQKLNGALSERVEALQKEIAELRLECTAEIEALIKDHSEGMAALRDNHSKEIEAIRRAHGDEIEEMRRQHRTEMKTLRELNEGLQRQIAQNTQSAAYLIENGKKAKDSGPAK